MRAASITMTLFSALLIAAHFFRSGSYVLAGASVLSPVLLMVKNRIALRLVQLLLLLAAAEWMRTLLSIALERQALGQSWMRMTAILGTVAAFSLASAFLLGHARQQAT